ncbi:hypothetical protein Q1695_007061 [Nippostrongylus brasiliensis]|nr:hypothetical protein Q1695_007061 [Nippostrongylus brasiliensis]
MGHVLNRLYVFCGAVLVILGAVHIMTASKVSGPTVFTPMIEQISSCLPFHDFLEIHAKIIDLSYREHNGSISPMAAYAFPDYSHLKQITGRGGQKVYCWYLDEEKRQIGPPVETVVEPQYTAYCCRRLRAHYMSISINRTLPINNSVAIVDRTKNAPKYRLSHCLSPLYGNGTKWLLFTEFVEHYKLVGVEHFYVYVKDIDGYSKLVIDDYVRTGEIETIFLRTNDRPGVDYQLVAVHDCLHRSRHHSRYVIFGDLDERIVLSGTATLSDFVTKVMTLHPNVRSVRFRPRYVLYTQAFPNQYQGNATLNTYLPTLVYHNTSPAQPVLGDKCIVDPTAVMAMGAHMPSLFFSNYKTFYVPIADASIRSYAEPRIESLSLIAAYGFPDYSVITFETQHWKGQKAYCWYLDEEKRQIGPPVETVIEPEYTAYCCRRYGAHYMSISSDLPIRADNYVSVVDRTQDAPKYQLSHCLSPLHGNGPKWLSFAEFVEHYKLVGVEHFYVYVKDIDEYSNRVLDDYMRTGEIETIFLRTKDRPGGVYLYATIPDCLYRSRHHSRYVIFGDLDEKIVLSGTVTLSDYIKKVTALHPNVGSIRFRPRFVLQTRGFPRYYRGGATLRKHLPTLAYHNTTPVQGEFGDKCIVDPRAVMAMSVHKPILFFSSYKTFNVPVADGFIRHIRKPDVIWAATKLQRTIFNGKMENTNYPEHLMPILYQRPRVSTLTLSVTLTWKRTQMAIVLTEFVEHYKLIGVEHFYVYVKDIDEYSARVINDYVKTGEIETTFLRTNDRPGDLYLYATIQMG